jgi:hypothetical protein
MTSMTIETKSAADIKRQDDAIAFLYALYSFSDFIDDAHDLMSDDRSGFERRAPVVHMQVAATNAAGCDPQNSIRGFL